MTFAFKELSVAKQLKRLVRPKPVVIRDGLDDILSRALIFRTPVGGIPARIGNVCGSAACTVYRINADGHLVAYRGVDDQLVSLIVYNIATDVVGGEKFIMAKDCLGKPVVDFELCDDESSWSDSSFQIDDGSSSSGPDYMSGP